MSKLCRRGDLTISFTDDGQVVLRSIATGEEAVTPAEVVPLLAWCTAPRSRDEVIARFGPGAGPAFDAFAQGGLLVTEAERDHTPTFFTSFTSLDVHRRMLSDAARVDGFAAAIQAAVKPGMVVLDAGTGTGVLAIIAAKAGAKHVYAVDRAEILALAETIAVASGVADRITFLNADLKDVALPEPVDLVISETFGAFALAEGGIEDVAACCARNLKPGGTVIPNRVDLFLAPVVNLDHVPETIACFRDQHGADLTPLRASALRRGIVQTVAPEALGHPGVLFVSVPFPGDPRADGDATFNVLTGTQLHGWLGWFDLHMFDDQRLPTGPDAPRTHWMQVFLPIDPVTLQPDQPVEASIWLEPAIGDRRGLEVTIHWKHGAAEGQSLHRIV